MLKKPIHLSPGEILALAEGRPADARTRAHLSDCAQCRIQVDEARRTVISIPSTDRSVSDEHAGEDLLLALIHEALSPSRARHLHQHLRQCSSCLVKFERLQRLPDSRTIDLQYARRGADTRARLRGMTPRPGESLGRLIVRLLQGIEPPVLEFVPPNAPRFGSSFEALASFAEGPLNSELECLDFMAPPDAPSSPHPASAGARRLRSMGREGGEAIEPPSPEPTVCQAGPFRFEITASGSPGQRELLIQIRDASGSPMAHEPVALEVSGHDRATRRTDDHGNLRFPLPTRKLRLRLGEHLDSNGFTLEIEVQN